ncbi:MAG: penicillin-binding protein, partial [Oscillospiraceae bacterium]
MTAHIPVIKAARGEIVDRYGRTLATNKTAYNVVFYRVFMPTEETNKIINDLCKLMESQNEKWIDNLPLSFDVEKLEFIENMENQTSSLKSYLKLNSYATPENVLDNLISKYYISDDFTLGEKRIIAGVRYGMDRAGFSYNTNYTFAQDISNSTLSLIKEQGFNLQGVDVEAEPIREYTSGTVAPHLIGSIGPIYPEEYEKLKEKGYSLDAILGKSGIEKSFEEYLKGTNGIRK